MGATTLYQAASRCRKSLCLLATLAASFANGCSAQSTPTQTPVSTSQSAAETSGQASNATGSAGIGGPVDSLATRSGGLDWPHFLGPTYNSVSSETGILKDWSKGKLKALWSRPLGTSYGIGSVAKGRYLQLERIGDVERLACLNAETGEELWHSDQPVRYEDMYGYNNGPRSSPTIVEDLVYTLGVAGQLTCRNLAAGEVLWTINVNDEYGVIQNFFGVGASPVVHEGLVIVMVGGSPAADRNLAPGQLDRVSPNGTGVVAFDRITGKEVYRVGDCLASYSTPRPFAFHDQTWMLAFMREGLLAFRADNGEQQWLFPWRSPKLESVNAAVPVVQGNQILVSECYDIGSVLLQVDDASEPTVVRSDSRRQREQSMRAHWSTPICLDSYLYGCSGRNPGDSDFRCVDWKTGEVMWSIPRRERTSLLSIDNHLIVLGERGELSLIKPSPESFQFVTSLDLAAYETTDPNRPRLRYPCWAAPIVSHGLLYVRGSENLICFELIPE